MLSRVAERVYWLARYLERTENTARLMLVRHQAVLDLPRDVQPGWDLLLNVLGAEEDFAALPGGASEKNIISFVFGERENHSSIISSLTLARENMRTSREMLPNETWERVNSLYLSVARRSSKELPRSVRHNVLNSIIESCQQITGMLAGTMNHDAAYHFLRMGRNLERADMTTRIMDAGSADLMKGDVQIEAYQNILWASILQSLSAHQMYRLGMQSNVSAAGVLDFLFKNKSFPRAIAHTLIQVDQSLRHLPAHKNALKTVQSAQRKLSRTRTGDLYGDDLHAFIDVMQERFADIHQEIANTWFSLDPLA